MDIFGGHRKTGLFWGIISIHSRTFSKVKVHNWNIFWVANLGGVKRLKGLHLLLLSFIANSHMTDHIFVFLL